MLLSDYEEWKKETQDKCTVKQYAEELLNKNPPGGHVVALIFEEIYAMQVCLEGILEDMDLLALPPKNKTTKKEKK